MTFELGFSLFSLAFAVFSLWYVVRNERRIRKMERSASATGDQ